MLEQDGFEHSQLTFGRGRLEQPFAKHSTGRAPELVELDEAVMCLAERRRKKRRSAAELEVHHRETTLLPRIDYRRLRVGASQHRAAGPMDGRAIRPAVGAKLVFVQVHQQVYSIRRQD